MSQASEKRERKKRVRKRWAGLDSVQVRLRVPGELADRLGTISAKQRARIVALLLCADPLGIDLEAMASPDLRKELIRQGVNINQASRELRVIRGMLAENELDGLAGRIEAELTRLDEAVMVIARLRKVGAL